MDPALGEHSGRGEADPGGPRTWDVATGQSSPTLDDAMVAARRVLQTILPATDIARLWVRETTRGLRAKGRGRDVE